MHNMDNNNTTHIGIIMNVKVVSVKPSSVMPGI